MKEYITNAGYELLSRMLSGDCTIEYTKVQMGNGTPTEADLKRMTALSNPVVTLDVESVKIETDNTVDITASFTNAEITEAFYYKEKGIFASDGKKEVLFSYAYTTDPELIPPHSEEYMEKRLKSILKQLQSVDAPINIKVKSGIYVPISDYNRDMEAVEETFKQKVDKEEGKGLSSEDYTTEEKKKLKDTVDLVDKELKVLEEHNKNMTFGSYDKHEYTYDGNYGINSAVQQEKNVKVKDAISSDEKNIESIRTAVNTIGEKLHGEVDDVKRNLNKNGYSEIAGGKNLLNPNKFLNWVNQYTTGRYLNNEITISPVTLDLYYNFFKFSDIDIDVTLSINSLIFKDGTNPRVCLVNSEGTTIGAATTTTPSVSGRTCGIKIDYSNPPTSLTIKELMIEEGSVATEYEPYFPSNKMLAEETISLDTRLSDNGYGEVAGGKNLANPKNFVKNKVVSFDTGYIVDNPNYFVSGYIEVKPNTTYVRQGASYGAENYSYDENKKPISIIGTKFTTSSNTKYVCLSGLTGKENIMMLEEGSVATSYEPYFPSNKMLAEEKADKTETTVNLLNPTLQTTTQNGVTCTNNGDGTYTLNGTANSTARFILKGGFNCSQFVGMKLVGCPSKAIVGGVRKFAIVMEAAASPWNTNADDIGNGSIIVGPSGNSNLFIAVYEGATLDNLVFKPMITTNLSATYDDFVQYTGDSGSLNKDVGNINKDLNNLGLDNLYTDTLQYGSINTDGAVLTISSAKHDESYKPCKEGDTISIITEVSYGQHGVAFYNANKEFISLSVNSVIGNRISVTAPNGAKFFRYYISNLEGGTRDITASNIGKISVFVNSKIEEDILDGRCRELLWVNDENVKEVGFSTNYTVPNIQDYDLFELIVVDSTDANYTLAQEPRRTVVFSSYLREFFESVRKDGDSVVIARRCIDVFPNRKKDQIEPYNAATITISSSGVSQSEDNTIFIPYTLYGLRKKVK